MEDMPLNIKIENVGEQDKPLQAFMNGQISVLANLKVGENISATLTYVNNELFVDYNGMFGAKMPAQVIAYLIGAVLDNKEQLNVKEYGVIVTSGMKRGLLLPDLDGIDTIEQQVSIAKKKAGIKDEPYTLQRFKVTRHK